MDSAAVAESAHRLCELPHHSRVLRRAEVEAVRHRDRPRSCGGHVSVGLGQRELRSGIGIEQAEPPVAVGGDRDAQLRVLVDSQHASVVRGGKHRVAADVPVVLPGNPALVGASGRASLG